MTENNSLKYLGQFHSDKYALAKERIPITQVLLTRISLKYC